MAHGRRGRLVTHDKGMHRGIDLDPIDRQVIHAADTGEDLVPITSVEQLEELARATMETKAVFDALVRDMTQDQAAFVRYQRCDLGKTWRGVARACWEAWGHGFPDWQPPSNQIMGMALCERASAFTFREGANVDWN